MSMTGGVRMPTYRARVVPAAAGITGSERQREGEPSAFAHLARDLDLAAVRRDDAPRDREAEASAALLGAAVPVAVEHVRQLGGLMPGPWSLTDVASCR